MNIVLIGYRACGKTTVSKLLAEQAAMERISSDEELVRRLGMTIANYVAANGWPEFRRQEAKVIGELSSRDGWIIDAGGGVVEDAANIEQLSQKGFVVWMKAGVGEIMRRLTGDTTRPSLSGDKDARQEVAEVLARREELYRRAAHFEVDSEKHTPEEAATAILAAARKSLPLDGREA
jgi:shikimate kinase